ncbi:hypothetical protein BV25DRAFT_1920809 [Artomyces pyxidatus]|uniref:Uncharacterized protein n=1 Tax=Artomyces pyxidatus TaxID=48021 RepID=A0ACB8SLL8_9AGAM|nr:hypothetical protein BV25DRAFT_1920809 [Artomyces pyxidatus]
MLVFVLLMYACLDARTSNGFPTATETSLLTRANSTVINIPTLNNSSCPDIDNCRTLYDIVWSSLATIFACVWTAVHRNIPRPSQRRLLRMSEMARVMLVTLLVPEWVLAWAVRQFLNARNVGKELEAARAEAERSWEEKGRWRLSGGGSLNNVDRTGQAGPGSQEDCHLVHDCSALEDAYGAGRMGSKWTTRHGFFIIMGGLHFFEKGVPRHPLSSKDVVELVKTGALVPPTEDEIELLSQGDALSKTIAVLQTLWFVVQYIARRVQGLPIAQIEVMTLAYTTITVAMYAFWWYKPLNVGGPIRVTGKTLPEPEPAKSKEGQLMTAEVILGTHDNFVDLRQMDCAPTFYGGAAVLAVGDNAFLADVVALVAAMVFGAVHCLAWSYVFPSKAETLLWRMSSSAIIAVPGSLVIATLVAVCVTNTALETVGGLSIALTFIIAGPVYIAARLVLLALSFSSLRTLPTGVYQTVQWTIRIPHFS